MPLLEELKIIRESAGLCEGSNSGHLRIEGPDAPAFLQRIVTNEVTTLPVGEGRHNALLDRKGMVLSLFYLFRLAPDSFQIITPPQLTEKTLALFKKFKVIEKLAITDVSGEWGLRYIFGKIPPTPLFQSGVKEGCPPLAKGGWGGFSWQDNFYKLPVWNIVSPAGTPLIAPLQNLPKISKTAFDLIRMESGIPEYGVDIDETHILLEANLHHCYKRQKGCYPGQEVIERILAYGKGRTPRALVVLEADGKTRIGSDAQVTITSSQFNPLDNKTIALGYMERKLLDSTKGSLQIGNNVVRVFQPDGKTDAV